MQDATLGPNRDQFGWTRPGEVSERLLREHLFRYNNALHNQRTEPARGILEEMAPVLLQALGKAVCRRCGKCPRWDWKEGCYEADEAVQRTCLVLASRTRPLGAMPGYEWPYVRRMVENKLVDLWREESDPRVEPLVEWPFEPDERPQSRTGAMVDTGPDVHEAYEQGLLDAYWELIRQLADDGDFDEEAASFRALLREFDQPRFGAAIRQLRRYHPKAFEAFSLAISPVPHIRDEKEIAAVLKINHDTARQRVSRARRWIEEFLHQWEFHLEVVRERATHADPDRQRARWASLVNRYDEETIHTAMYQLKRDHGKVYEVMILWRGKEPKEIANLLETTLDAVYQTGERALDLLENYLKDPFFNTDEEVSA